MTCRACLVALLTGGLLLASQDEKKAAPVPAARAEEGPPVLRLARQASKPPARALEWSLLVDPLDQVPGNAAPMWLRAGSTARAVRHKWTEAEDKWINSGPEGMALKDLPKKTIKELLDKYAAAFRLAEQASLRTRCDWDHPPLTMQNVGDIPFDDIQSMREMARLLSLRFRLHLAEQRFDAALKDLRIGLALGRHVGESDYLIQNLVGIAISAIMLGRLEEWQQTQDSPNLYWALCELPRPYVDVGKSIRSELNTIYRSFPTLRDLKAKKLSAPEAQALVEKFFEAFARMTGHETPAWQRKLGTAALALKYYPAAKKALIERGRSEKEVEAIPTVQAVALHYLEEYDRVRDEFVKLLGLPLWQSYPAMEKIDQVERAKARENGNVILGSLMPALYKVYAAQARLERLLDGHRAAEALRMHIARHGRPPQKWADLTDVPLPIDPITGKGFDAWYSFKDGKATLDVPAPPGQSARIGKRFEFVLQGR